MSLSFRPAAHPRQVSSSNWADLKSVWWYHYSRAQEGSSVLCISESDHLVQELGSPLPEMPPNVRFVNHSNECYDWGTMGWLLSSKLVNPALYQYFIFMNSSVRGPFIPPYLWVRASHACSRLASQLVAMC